MAKFLCRRLAHAARYTNQQRVESGAVIGAHRNHRIQRIVHKHTVMRIDPRYGVLCHNARRPGLQRLCGKRVAVRTLSPNAHKQAARANRAAVCCNGKDIGVSRQAAQSLQQNA